MRANVWVLAIGAATGAVATAAVVGVMVLIGSVAGSGISVFEELIGLAYVDGPRWLAPVVGALVILGGGIAGSWAVTGRDGRLRRSQVGALIVVGTYLTWTFLWTAWRLGPNVATSPLLPFYSALLAMAGVLLPVVLLVLPIAALWAWIVGRLIARPDRRAN